MTHVRLMRRREKLFDSCRDCMSSTTCSDDKLVLDVSMELIVLFLTRHWRKRGKYALVGTSLGKWRVFRSFSFCWSLCKVVSKSFLLLSWSLASVDWRILIPRTDLFLLDILGAWVRGHTKKNTETCIFPSHSFLIHTFYIFFIRRLCYLLHKKKTKRDYPPMYSLREMISFGEQKKDVPGIVWIELQLDELPCVLDL